MPIPGRTQQAYLPGEKDKAGALVSDRLVEDITLVDPPDRVREDPQLGGGGGIDAAGQLPQRGGAARVAEAVLG